MRIARSLTAIIATILIAALPLAAPAQFSVGVGFNIGSAPPPMPYYAQPAAPYPNYQWTARVLGLGIRPATTGSRHLGRPADRRRFMDARILGLQSTATTAGTTATGARPSASTAASTTDSAIPAPASTAAPGAAAPSDYNTAVVNVNRTVIHNTYNKTVVNNERLQQLQERQLQRRQGRHQRAGRRKAQIQARTNGRPPTTAQVQQAQVAAQDRNLARERQQRQAAGYGSRRSRQRSASSSTELRAGNGCRQASRAEASQDHGKSGDE